MPLDHGDSVDVISSSCLPCSTTAFTLLNRKNSISTPITGLYPMFSVYSSPLSAMYLGSTSNLLPLTLYTLDIAKYTFSSHGVLASVSGTGFIFKSLSSIPLNPYTLDPSMNTSTSSTPGLCGSSSNVIVIDLNTPNRSV